MIQHTEKLDELLIKLAATHRLSLQRAKIAEEIVQLLLSVQKE